jgi:hypothetical protein
MTTTNAQPPRAFDQPIAETHGYALTGVVTGPGLNQLTGTTSPAASQPQDLSDDLSGGQPGSLPGIFPLHPPIARV